MKASSRPPSANDLARAAVADVVAAKNNSSAAGGGGDAAELDGDAGQLHPAKAVAHPPSLPAMSGAPSSRGGGQSSRGPSASPSGATDGDGGGDDDESGGGSKKRQHQQQQKNFGKQQKNGRGANPASLAPPPPPPLVPAVPVNAHRQPRLPPEERAARMRELSKAREALERLPMGETFEIPGRPGLMYELRDYSKPFGRVDRKEGIRCARQDLPFLFRAFEAGQAPPPRPGTKRATEARAATIHEYLDWTVSAEESTPEEKSAAEARRVRAEAEEAAAAAADEAKKKAAAEAAAGAAASAAAAAAAANAAAAAQPSTTAAATTTTSPLPAVASNLNLSFYNEADADADFSGFRTVVLLPRFRPGWPPPGAYDSDGPAPSVPALGAPKPPLPTLLPHGKPICAATVRSSLGYLEVPFFATQESRRNRGYGRALLECCETVARALGLPHLLLCSTDDKVTRATWTALGFSRSTEDQLRDEFGIKPGDLLHMDNTVQMHKRVPQAKRLRPVVLRHGSLVQRLYFEPPADAAAAATAAAAAAKAAGAAGGGLVAAENGKRSLPPPPPESSPAVKGEGDDEAAAAAAPGSSTKRARFDNGGGGGGGGSGGGAAAGAMMPPPAPR